MAKRDDTSEPKSPIIRPEGAALRERLSQRAGSDLSMTPLAIESGQRIEKLAALSKWEIEEYTAARSRKRWLRSVISKHSDRALLLLSLVGAIAVYLVSVPKAWWTFSAWNSATDTALTTPAVYRYGDGVKAGLVEAGLVEGLRKRTETNEPVEHRPSNRYLLKVVTHPPGATLLVEDKSFITPVEMEVTNTKSALRIKLSKESYRSIRRLVTTNQFQPEGSSLTYRLNVKLKKQSSKMLPGKQPRVTTPDISGLNFYLEPLPEVPKRQPPHP